MPAPARKNAKPKVARIDVTHRPADKYTLVAFDRAGNSLGTMDLEVKTERGQRFTQVVWAFTRQTGAGVGTKLYERAARVACQEGAPLSSDTRRTKYSEQFWRKQAQKGRATCRVPTGGKHLSDDFAHVGTWSCGRYALSCPAPRSLRGVKR